MAAEKRSIEIRIGLQRFHHPGIASQNTAWNLELPNELNLAPEPIAAALEAGKSATESEVQALFARWHQHLRYFYEPPLELLAGLATLYTSDARFIAEP